jgi:hypothetical protein
MVLAHGSPGFTVCGLRPLSAVLIAPWIVLRSAKNGDIVGIPMDSHVALQPKAKIDAIRNTTKETKIDASKIVLISALRILIFAALNFNFCLHPIFLALL